MEMADMLFRMKDPDGDTIGVSADGRVWMKSDGGDPWLWSSDVRSLFVTDKAIAADSEWSECYRELQAKFEELSPKPEPAPEKGKQDFADTILEEAEKLVNGDRRRDYGHPLDNFTFIAEAWAPIFKDGVVTPEKVALAMISVKMMRLINSPDHRDSQVDIAGYIRTYEMVIEEKARRAAEAK